MITYSTKKDLPCEPLLRIFQAVGWSDGTETQAMVDNFNKPFINSTIVISAWDGETLVGCVRALSDQMFRSIIYDLAVLPQYQKQGIGKELVRRCREHFPNSEWLVQTIPERVGFYESMGFQRKEDPFLNIPCKWF